MLRLISRTMSMEQSLAAALEQGVLALNAVEMWQRELKGADEQGRFTFSGMSLRW